MSFNANKFGRGLVLLGVGGIGEIVYLTSTDNHQCWPQILFFCIATAGLWCLLSNCNSSLDGSIKDGEVYEFISGTPKEQNGRN